jgi:hypothetical protein
MVDHLQKFGHHVAHGVDLVVNHAVHVNVWWIAAGLVLHYVSQAVRLRGWFNIIRAAYPGADGLRARDVLAAYFAGAGMNAVVPARGGDVLKLYMVKRRVPRSRYSTLVATLVPETLFETACGIALVIWALARGFLPVPSSPAEWPSIDVSFVLNHPFISSVVLGVAAVLVAYVVRRVRRNAEQFVARVRRGTAILGRPARYFTGVVTWQALGRVVRLGSLACFLAAFDLPVTASTVVLVMAAQGAGRIIPLAPASNGARLAMLAYGFVEVTGQNIDIANLTAFSFGMSFILFIASTLIALVLIGREFGTVDPRRAVAAARAALAERRAPGKAAEQPG